jgi:hypothetical protein
MIAALGKQLHGVGSNRDVWRRYAGANIVAATRISRVAQAVGGKARLFMDGEHGECANRAHTLSKAGQ